MEVRFVVDIVKPIIMISEVRIKVAVGVIVRIKLPLLNTLSSTICNWLVPACTLVMASLVTSSTLIKRNFPLIFSDPFGVWPSTKLENLWRFNVEIWPKIMDLSNWLNSMTICITICLKSISVMKELKRVVLVIETTSNCM